MRCAGALSFLGEIRGIRGIRDIRDLRESGGSEELEESGMAGYQKDLGGGYSK